MTQTSLRLYQPSDVITIGYQLVMMALIVTHISDIPSSAGFLIYHILIISFVLILPYLGKGKILDLVKNWNSLIIIATNFSELHYLVHTVNPIDLDSVLIKLDLIIFGVHPTVWFESISFPLLTEYMQWIYATFYFLPMILGVIIYRKGHFVDFHLFIFVIVLGFYLSYFGYFLVPAIGPRFTLNHVQMESLTGVWLTSAMRDALNSLEGIQRDAFPSGHTEITLLTMMYARRHSKIYFYILLVIGTSLIISTVYLRYHYVVDVFAGIMLAISIYLTAPYLFGKIRKSRIFKFYAQDVAA